MSIQSVMLFNHLILCRLLLFLPSIFPSIRVFSSELALHTPKYWSFSCSISPFNEYSGLISFRINWFDLFGVQGTLKSLLALQLESISSSALSLLYLRRQWQPTPVLLPGKSHGLRSLLGGSPWSH